MTLPLTKTDSSGRHLLKLRACENCHENHYLRNGRKFCSVKCMGEARRGSNNPAYYPPRFTGTMTEYKRFHKRVYDARGSATDKHCEDCGSMGNSQWANETGKYEDPNDYIVLCPKCHAKFDRAS